MINEDYCSYEVAKLLKEKGFNVPCLAHWFIGTNRNFSISNTPQNWNEIKTDLDWLSCQTHQMAMKWLREVYDIFIDIGYDDLDWYWLIESISKDIPYEDRPELIKNGTACHKTYEEAVEAALKYSLKNLI